MHCIKVLRKASLIHAAWNMRVGSGSGLRQVLDRMVSGWLLPLVGRGAQSSRGQDEEEGCPYCCCYPWRLEQLQRHCPVSQRDVTVDLGGRTSRQTRARLPAGGSVILCSRQKLCEVSAKEALNRQAASEPVAISHESWPMALGQAVDSESVMFTLAVALQHAASLHASVDRPLLARGSAPCAMHAAMPRQALLDARCLPTATRQAQARE